MLNNFDEEFISVEPTDRVAYVGDRQDDRFDAWEGDDDWAFDDDDDDDDWDYDWDDDDDWEDFDDDED